MDQSVPSLAPNPHGLALKGVFVCHRCGGLLEERASGERPEPQACDCQREDDTPPWPGYDFNEWVRLCDCCGSVALPSGSRFSTFFYALARNRARDLLRSRRRRSLHRSEHPIDAETLPGWAQNPEQTLIDRYRVDALRDSLDVLSRDDRILLVLRDCEEVSVAELSSIFSIPAGTVKSRLSRARARVARQMREKGYE